MFTRESIIETIFSFSHISQFPNKALIISIDAALVMCGKKEYSEVLDVEVLPHTFIKLNHLYPKFKHVGQSTPRRNGSIDFIKELRINTEDGLFKITSLLTPTYEITTTDGVWYRTVPSVVDIKRYLATPKDFMDIVTLGYTP